MGFFDDFSISVPLDFDKHAADLAFDVPRLLDPGLTLEDFAAPPKLPEEAVRAARRLISMVPIDAKIVAIHADTAKQKSWARDRFVALVEAMLVRHPDAVIFELGSTRRIVDWGGCADKVISCIGLPLELSLSLLRMADMFIGVDSSVLHAADFFRVPGVGIFGATAPSEWGFRVGPHRHVCGPSMEQITVSATLDAVEFIWQNHVALWPQNVHRAEAQGGARRNAAHGTEATC